MLEPIAQVLDWLGIVVFATSGALAASRKQMDVVGFALLATATGIGGGTLRDMMMGLLPVFWVTQPTYLIVCVAVAAVMFFTAHIPQSRLRLLRRRGPSMKRKLFQRPGDVNRHVQRLLARLDRHRLGHRHAGDLHRPRPGREGRL